MNRNILLSLAALLLFACGASNPATRSPNPAAATADASDSEWSDSSLRRLDHELRSHVRRGTTDRIAIKVYFRESPSDEELSTLLLSRVGRQVIGQVRLATLHEIATRTDVDRIESINDAGY